MRDKPKDHDLTTVLVLYCSSCGSILGAADFSPRYPDLAGIARHEVATERLAVRRGRRE